MDNRDSWYLPRMYLSREWCYSEYTTLYTIGLLFFAFVLNKERCHVKAHYSSFKCSCDVNRQRNCGSFQIASILSFMLQLVFPHNKSLSILLCPTIPCFKSNLRLFVQSCAKAECDIQCSHPVPQVGKCCAMCDGCYYQNHTYRNGMTFHLDACQSCSCSNGNVQCTTKTCQPLSCSVDKQVQ